MKVRRRGRTVVERLGGVFAPAEGASTVVYAFGPRDSTEKEALFSCPVSAIPPAVWSLLDLWFVCRTMRALPIAGGVIDQPLSVRRSFPIFEIEHEAELARRDAHAGALATAAVLGVGRRGK